MSTPDADYGDAFHWGLDGEHVLFASVRLDSAGGLLAGALLTAGVCACERLLTYAHERRWAPARVRRAGGGAGGVAGGGVLGARAAPAYMLIAMTFHAGLILIAATTLAIGQFFIELRTAPQLLDREYAPLDDPRPHRHRNSYSMHAHPKAEHSGTGRTDFEPPAPRLWDAGDGPEAARGLLGAAQRSPPFQVGGHGHGHDSEEED
ncbi:hypothetical protein MIND_00549800 [Mycena indigotica]|uniref:Copper transporter n=1 Tax=Mycena indigotica TaxID=2126181 RepID=A0A8H6SWK3_9AGAR|nr:uncharacterized protein MIND_00549800 [Mycena indigotica]KAF7307550.1 hypothetical protein MIND_00549800 [Mycena indigotica]